MDSRIDFGFTIYEVKEIWSAECSRFHVKAMVFHSFQKLNRDKPGRTGTPDMVFFLGLVDRWIDEVGAGFDS